MWSRRDAFTKGVQVGVALGAAACFLAVRAAERRSQAWFWTPDWQAGEAEARADIAAGRTIYYDSDEAFAAALADPPPPRAASGGLLSA